MENLEIERRWLLRDTSYARFVPDDSYWINQYYNANGRFRSIWNTRTNGKEYTHTIKTGQGLVRTEVEKSISLEDFTSNRHISDPTIIKRRQVFLEDGIKWELDAILLLGAKELWILECELPTADTIVEVPARFQPYVVREITDDPRYGNYQLATMGLPQDDVSESE